MTTPANPDDLITWLRAQIDEDEEVASDAAGLGNSRRHWKREAISCVVDTADSGLIVYGEGTPTPEQAEHIARHDPARVLAEVDAKRRILDEVVDEATGLDMQVDNEFRVGTRDTAAEPYLGDMLLRLLALPYADRPGYREEWKP